MTTTTIENYRKNDEKFPNFNAKCDDNDLSTPFSSCYKYVHANENE